MVTIDRPQSGVIRTTILVTVTLAALAGCGQQEVPSPPPANAAVNHAACSGALGFLRQIEDEAGNDESENDEVALNDNMAQTLTAMGNDVGNSEPYATVNRLMNDIGKSGNPYPNALTITENAYSEVKQECSR